MELPHASVDVHCWLPWPKLESSLVIYAMYCGNKAHKTFIATVHDHRYDDRTLRIWVRKPATKIGETVLKICCRTAREGVLGGAEPPPSLGITVFRSSSNRCKLLRCHTNQRLTAQPDGAQQGGQKYVIHIE